MDTSQLTTPQLLGKALKCEFKKRGIDIQTRYIKTVRELDNSWYEISTFKSNQIIPNELRKEILTLSYDKTLEEMKISNVDNISYGNVQSQRIAVYGRDWKKWLEGM